MRKNTNVYKINGETTEIITVKGDVILIDSADIELAKSHCWHVDSKGYAHGGTSNKRFRLHNLLMNPSKGMVVDHINRNKLDNRRCNLRLVTNQENQFNRGLGKNNRSGHVGIHFNKQCEKWCCQLTHDRKIVFSGLFDSKEEAIAKRESLEKEYFKIER